MEKIIKACFYKKKTWALQLLMNLFTFLISQCLINWIPNSFIIFFHSTKIQSYKTRRNGKKQHRIIKKHKEFSHQFLFCSKIIMNNKIILLIQFCCFMLNFLLITEHKQKNIQFYVCLLLCWYIMYSYYYCEK
jgi:hypothetical protein